ncbi:MAG: hypothetical protein ABJA89_00775 [Lapillicoccus sp.]
MSRLIAVARSFGPWPAVLLMSTGLLLVALAATATRPDAATTDPPTWHPAYVLGILLVVVPAAVGIALPRARPHTPAVLAVAMAALLTTAQLLVRPTVFVRDDDVARVLTVRELVQSEHLFGAGGITPDLAALPGLALATTAVRALTGLSTFASAAVLVVLVQTVLAGVLLLLGRHLTRSARIGALAAVLYAASPSLLVAGDLWSPGRLATALAVLAAYLLVTRRRRSRVSAGPAVLALVAVAWTDQRTAVVAAVGLVVWLLLDALLRPAATSSVPALATATALAVLAVAVVAVHASTVTDGAAVRDRPLSGTTPTWLDVAGVAPGWAVVLLVAAPVVVVVGVALGLRRSRFFVATRVSAAVLLALGGLLSMLLAGTVGVDAAATASAWGGGLVLVGAAFVPAWWFWQRPPVPARAVALGLAVGLVGLGGAVGVPVANLPAGQTTVVAGARGYDPDTVAAVRWLAATLPADRRVYADPTGGLLLTLVGRQTPVTTLLSDSIVLQQALAENGVQYVVADRRNPSGPSPDTLRIVAQSPVVSTVYDNGAVIVYALEGFDAPR